jgi:hypothetical protein
MKTIYNNIILGFLILLMFSCYKDKSSTLFTKSDQLIIKNIEEKYNLISDKNIILKINPDISFEDGENFKDSDFEYLWTYHNNDMSKSDTISEEKNLEYNAINFRFGDFKLVFIVKNTKTGVSVFNETDITIEALKSRGWYILKDNNGYTDLDLYNSKGLITDIIHKSGGSPLEGNAVRIGFTAHYAYFDPNASGDNKDKMNLRCLIPMSKNDVSVIQIDDTKELGSHNDLFYVTPEFSKPAFWIAMNRNISYVNNNKLYAFSPMDNTLAKMGAPIPVSGDYDYSLSKYFIQSHFLVPPTVFDKIQSSFYYLVNDGWSPPALSSYGMGQYPTKNLDSDLLYMSYQTNEVPNSSAPPYFGGIGTGIALLKKHTEGTLSLAYLDMFANLTGMPLIYKLETLPTGLDIATADLYAINRTKDFLYYTKANNISYYDMANQTETVIHSLAPGEEITYIHHSKYTEPDATEYNFDKLVVASYSNGNYKVYLFDILNDGKLKTDDPIIIEGEGKVAHTLYVSPKLDDVAGMKKSGRDAYVNYNY